MESILAFASSPEMTVGAVGFCCGVAAGAFVGKKSAGKPTNMNVFANRPKYIPGQTPHPPSVAFGKSKEVFDPTTLASCYNIMISSVTPRPIALVSSRSKPNNDNSSSNKNSPIVDNVAPFSYFGAVGHDPPMIIGICRKGPDKVMKDSLVNILARKEFCVNIMSEWYLDAANHSCGDFDPNVDEFEATGLTKVNDCQVVDAPRVGEAAVSYECKVEHVHHIKNEEGNPTTEVILARIVRVHVDRTVLAENFDPRKPAVDTTKLKPIGRLGGNIYTSLGDLVDIPRPKV